MNLDEMRARHQPRHSFRDPEGAIPQDWCDDCDAEYPCDASKLLALLTEEQFEGALLSIMIGRVDLAADRALAHRQAGALLKALTEE